MKIADMDSAALEEYAYDKQHELIGEKATLDGLVSTACAIEYRWKALGHPVAADSWAEAAKQLGLAAEHVEQAIKEVKD